MQNRNETQSIEWTVATNDESQWLVTLESLWTQHTTAGWQFVVTLRDGIDELGSKTDKGTLYDLVANQCNVSAKRLQNLTSMARRASSMVAMELGLEIAHAEYVLGLTDTEAIAILNDAAEQRWTPAMVSAEVRNRRIQTTAAPHQDLPVVGNERHTDDEPPFARTANNPLYDEYDTESDQLAGSSAAAHDFGDDEDGYTYTGAEFMALMQRATNRLRDTEMWQEQRTVNEWLAMVARHTY